jgi:hypothetical protein
VTRAGDPHTPDAGEPRGVEAGLVCRDVAALVLAAHVQQRGVRRRGGGGVAGGVSAASRGKVRYQEKPAVSAARLAYAAAYTSRLAGDRRRVAR